MDLVPISPPLSLYKGLAPPSTGYWEPAFMDPKLPRRHAHRLNSLEDREVNAEPTPIPSARVEKSPSPNNGLAFTSATGIYVLLSVIGTIAILG